MSLSQLESKKLLLNFKHTKEELLLKKEMISEIDPLFNQAIGEYLSSNDALKAEWESRFKIPDVAVANESLGMIVYTGDGDGTDVPEPEPEEPLPESEPEPDTPEEKTDEPFSSYKFIYREVVKKTHPDKVLHLPEEERLELCKIYMEATNAYERKDIGELIYYAYLIKVPLTIGNNEVTFLKGTLVKYKKESTVMEQTYSWKWYYSNDEEKKILIQRFVNVILADK